MFPVTAQQPPQLTVETLIERLKEGTPAFAPEEVEYLIHCLKEKKMKDFIINKLENKVLGLEEELDRERHLHENTLAYLETTQPSILQSMLSEKTRLRAALHDSFMENLKSENQKLKEQITLQKASNVSKTEKPEIIGFQKLFEDFVAPALLSKEHETLTDNYRISEFELQQKNQQISDLEEHIRVLSDDLLRSEEYQVFVENNTQKEYQKKIETLEEELKIKKANSVIRQFEVECFKKKNLEVMEKLVAKVGQLELALEKSPVVNPNQTRKELSKEEKRALKIHLEVLERKHQEFLNSVAGELKELKGMEGGATGTDLEQTNKNLLETIKKSRQVAFRQENKIDELNNSVHKRDLEIQKLKKEINKLEAENSSEVFRHENLIDELHKTHNKALALEENKMLTELTNQLKALHEENTQLKTEVHDQKIAIRNLKRENAQVEELFCKMQEERWRKENDYEAQLMEKNEEIAELELMAETGECSWSTLGLFEKESLETSEKEMEEVD